MSVTIKYYPYSVQFSRSVVSNSLQPHGLQHARLPCPSPTPGVYSNQWDQMNRTELFPLPDSLKQMTMTILHLQDCPPGRVIEKAIVVWEKRLCPFSFACTASSVRKEDLCEQLGIQAQSEIASQSIATKSSLQTHFET